jgi:arginyl-tRNA synthetase
VDADDLIDEMIATAKARTEELGKIDAFSPEESTELYSQLALGALKYFILKVDPKKRMLFNPKDSIDFQGNTGPFIQYTHARLSAILRKMEVDGIQADLDAIDGADLAQEEIEVVGLLKDANKKIKEAARLYAPSIVATYVYDLAKSFNRLYQNLPIFKDVSGDTQKIRLSICQLTAEEIKRSLSLLGISAPSRM